MREGIEGVEEWRNVWAKGGICVIELRGVDVPPRGVAVGYLTETK